MFTNEIKDGREVLSKPNKLQFSYPYILAIWWFKPLMFDLAEFTLWNIKGCTFLRFRKLEYVVTGNNLVPYILWNFPKIFLL